MDEAALTEFKTNSIYRLRESQRMIFLALEKIDENQLWQIPVVNGISIGNQLLHCCGNLTQYVISSLGNQPDNRERSIEFSTRGGYQMNELKNRLESTINEAIRTLQEASPKDYLSVRIVQGFELSGIGAVLHAVEHLSYHTGQIAFWIKQLTAEDLGFYDHHDLTQLNP